MGSYQGLIKEDILPGTRLDRYVAEYTGLLSRSQIKSRSMTARVNGREVKCSKAVKRGDRLELRWREAEPSFLVPQDIPLDIIYEDSRVVVIDKAQGMVVHPGAGNRQGTLANALLFRRLYRGPGGNTGGDPGLLPEGRDHDTGGGRAGLRPGIVHRLDKDTSGVMIAAWDDEALAFLAEQFKNRRVKKIYAALVQGVPRESAGRLQTLICRDRRDRKRFTVDDKRGKTAVTLYRVLRSWSSCSLVLLRPGTGRTHQIRVHMRYLGHPVIGDAVYGFAGSPFPGAGLMLHARSLSLVLPGHSGPACFRAPLPERFRLLAARAGGAAGKER
ncbi:MAG: RluA family pseudouridine synthase [Treponema sp.]|jgi:23S rRNA pseudouridine1911/1915/1917 synthase|nr:RluA family pseudouridine synthase [Treponema sp.]